MKAALFVCCALLAALSAHGAEAVVIGSKVFTESYVLAEIGAQSVESQSKITVKRRPGMGNTGILFEALKSGAIDVYPDYTGTLSEAILKRPELKSLEEISAALLKLDLVISGPLGFNDTYALAVKDSYAKDHGLATIGDLQKVQNDITAVFSYEFMERKDGYPGMVEAYRLRFNPQKLRRMEHNLSFQAVDDGAADVLDVYSTDAKIQRFHLTVLKDDRNFFPVYQAVWVARKAFVDAHPAEWRILRGLEGRIDAATMTSMNAQAEYGKQGFPRIASQFLGAAQPRAEETLAQKLWQRTKEHLFLVGVALVFSIVIGIPLGIAAVRFRAAGQGILIGSALVQTIPSLALLCFLIPVFGVGEKPALAALCLYSLLPVVLNTFTGVRGVDPRHIENARAFGLNGRQVLLRVVLPLASPTLLAGIKNATIVSIGTATLAALVGAGGYGAPIVSGLSLNDVPTILTGAIPAAVMALIAHGLFEAIGWVVIPGGLRVRQ
jgi:osmoprotectant transport system permease protein